MPKLKLSLSSKLIIFVAIALLFQIAFFISVLYLNPFDILSRLSLVLISSFGLTIIIGSIAALFIKRTLNPLKLLLKSTENSQQSIPDISLNIKSGDELQSLAERMSNLLNSSHNLSAQAQNLERSLIH